MKVRVEVRERRARQSKAQARKAFAKSMQAAHDYGRDLMRGQPKLPEGEPSGGPPALGLKFQEWGEAYYKYLKEGTALSKAHVEMQGTWDEIERTAEACAKATEARLGPRRRERQRKAAAARGRARVARFKAKAFARSMKEAAAVARAAKEGKYSEAAVAAGETEYKTNLEAWVALEERVGEEFRAYSVNKYHSLMWPESHKLSAASVEMEARWAEEMEDA
jgi:hypothetical protein